jgi:hypothetical protein
MLGHRTLDHRMLAAAPRGTPIDRPLIRLLYSAHAPSMLPAGALSPASINRAYCLTSVYSARAAPLSTSQATRHSS